MIVYTHLYNYTNKHLYIKQVLETLMFVLINSVCKQKH